MTITQPATVQPILGAIWQWLAHTVQWGNAQELLTWVVASAALVFAAKAAAAAHRTDVRQAEQLKELADDKRRAQAEKVAAWHEVSRTSVGNNPFPFREDTFVVQNGSDVPVYELWVAASGSLPEHSNFSVAHIDVVPPGIHHARMERYPSTDISMMTPRVLILFRDAASRHWLRRESGILEECDEDTWEAERSVLVYTREEIRVALQAHDASERGESGDPSD